MRSISVQFGQILKPVTVFEPSAGLSVNVMQMMGLASKNPGASFTLKWRWLRVSRFTRFRYTLRFAGAKLPCVRGVTCVCDSDVTGYGLNGCASVTGNSVPFVSWSLLQNDVVAVSNVRFPVRRQQNETNCLATKLYIQPKHLVVNAIDQGLSTRDLRAACYQSMCFMRHAYVFYSTLSLSVVKNIYRVSENVSCWLRFQFVTAASVEVTVFWDTAPCSLVEIVRRFRSAYRLCHHPDDGSRHLWNVNHEAAFQRIVIFTFC
jgi:hypothetical protein